MNNVDKKTVKITDGQAKDAIKQKESEAKNLMSNPDKLDRTLKEFEEKLKTIPVIGDDLSIIPTLIMMIRSYMRKEYTEVPVSTIVGIIAALIYVISPLDLVPDEIPVLGLADDLTILKYIIKIVKPDIDKYIKWRNDMDLSKLNEELEGILDIDTVDFVVFGSPEYLKDKLSEINDCILNSEPFYHEKDRNKDGLKIEVLEDDAAEVEMYLQEQGYKYM